MGRTKHRTLMVITIAVALVLLTPGRIQAASPEKLSLRWSELRSVLKGREVAARLTDGATVEGKFSSLQADTLSIRVTETDHPEKYPTGVTRLQKGEVSQLTLRPQGGKKGRIIGLIAGAAIAATAAGVLNAEANNESGNVNGGLIAGVAAGAIGIGGLVGWLADSAGSRPEQVILILPD